MSFEANSALPASGAALLVASVEGRALRVQPLGRADVTSKAGPVYRLRAIVVLRVERYALRVQPQPEAPEPLKTHENATRAQNT